jgi:hypothetical protein
VALAATFAVCRTSETAAGVEQQRLVVEDQELVRIGRRSFPCGLDAVDAAQ